MLNPDLTFILVNNEYLTHPKMYTPLGVLYVASAARRSGAEVNILDCRDQPLSLFPSSAIGHFVGFSCTTPEIDEAKRYSKKLRKRGYHTIVGGAHPSLMPDDCKGDFDTVVMGEGEEAVIEVMNHPYIKLLQRGRIKDLDKVAMPAWGLINDPFSDVLFAGERYGDSPKAMTIITSRGCPYHCAFCSNLLRTPVVFRSANNVLNEVHVLKAMKVNHYRFEDDNLLLLPEFKTLMEKLKDLDISFKGHSRSEHVTKEKVALLKQAGCEEFGLGVESADDDVLSFVKKGETAADHYRAVQILQDGGIRAKTYFMAGLPHETERTLELNMEFFLKAKPAKWTLSTFCPFPASDIYDNQDYYGIEIIEKDYSKWWNFQKDKFVFRFKNVSEGELYERYQRLYKFFKDNDFTDRQA